MTFGTFVNDYKVGFNAVVDSIKPEQIERVAEQLRQAFESGHQIFIAGNGGSAATASHMACDLAKTTLGKGSRLPTQRIKAIALSDNVPLITAWGNDVSYDRVFAEQLRNLANSGDTLVVISASGNSPSIVEVLHAAKELGLYTIALLGFEGGAVEPMVDCSVVVRSSHFGYIEDAHSLINHLITDYLKQWVQQA